MSRENHNVPKFSLKLIRWLCKEELVEELEGNLIEFYQSRTNMRCLRYWLQVFSFLRPSMLKNVNIKIFKMNINPISTAKRLHKYGISTYISFFGFALGLTCVFFLYGFIRSELNHDSYQTKTDNIYRVLRIGSMNGSPYDIGVTSVPFAPALENDFEGLIQSSTRAFPDRGLVKTENIEFYEDGLLFADANFFDFFSFPLLIGNKQSVLDSPNNVVISKSIAEKYFGFENPLGKTLKVDNTFELIVTGIMADVPNSSHLQFDIVLSLDIYRNARFYSHWWSNTLNTYVRIDSPQQANTVEGRFPDFMDKYFGEDFEASGTKIGLRLEPFSEIYFNKDTQYDMAIHGDLSTIYTLSIVAAVIMFIACFNYVNLAIAQSFQRAKEIAIRKVLGGEKVRLVFQMLSESLLIIITAIGISVALAILSFDSLKNLFRIQFELDWSDPNIILFLAALLFGTLLVSGLYPALALSNLDSNRTLKGIVQRGMSGSLLRKGLVILQFALAIILISSTLIISKQINFIGNKDLGFDRSSVILLNLNNADARNNMEQLKTELISSPRILSTSFISGEPGGFHDATTISVVGTEEVHRTRIAVTDEDYFSTFDISLLAGRLFDNEHRSDFERTAIINQKAMEMLGLSSDNLEGAKVDLVSWNLMNLEIIGVVEDYHFTSLKSSIEPLIIVNNESRYMAAIKIQGNTFDAFSEIESAWDNVSPAFPIQYRFLDEKLNTLYDRELKQKKVFSVFSSVSILLACMGVYGLVSHSTRRREKELGIRKILGANLLQVFQIISKEFLTLIMVSAALSIPIAYYAMANWLTDFAYHIDLMQYWYVFLVGSALAFIVSFLSIGCSTYKAAAINPTDSIRYE